MQSLLAEASIFFEEHARVTNFNCRIPSLNTPPRRRLILMSYLPVFDWMLCRRCPSPNA